MSWKSTFDKGVACFKRGDFEEALTHMNQAVELESNTFIIYDSRAAVYEKRGNIKAALRDSKHVIDLAPNRWQGYARSARLFELLGKHGSAIQMVDHALSFLQPEDVQRRTPLIELREKAATAQGAAEKERLSQVARTSYLLGTLPVETLVDIFSVLIDEDHTWAVKLSHVCGHWRRILINTPSAWQTLVLTKKHSLRKAKLWKERTKNRIAHISVAVSELFTATIFSQLQDLPWDNLSSLRISGTAFVELCAMLSNISLPHAFSNLDELALFDCVATDQLSCCLSGPNWKLRILRLTGTIYMMDKWWERIQQLKELYINGVVGRFSPLVFTNNPSLEKFVSDCETMRTAEIANGDFMRMDNLKTIECRRVTDPYFLLRTISAPSIAHFSLQSAMMADVALFHIASSPSLVDLRITQCSLSPSTLPTLLLFAPNLETLQVNAIQGVVNAMFQFLTPKTVDSQHVLPCRALKHVDVSKCSDLTTSSVHAFIKTRAQHVVSEEKCAVVESLKVDGCPNIEPDMLPWFRSRVAQFSCVYATKKDFVKDRRR